jgi:hypothetical protein
MSISSFIKKVRPHVSHNVWKLVPFTVDVEGPDGGSMRLLPTIWKGRIHLFGAEHKHWLRVDFSTPNRLRFTPVSAVKLTPGRAITPANEKAAAVHIVLCHLAPRQTERLLNHANQLGQGYTIVLAYGGRKDDFEKIDWPHKIFLDDPTLRGPWWLTSYYQIVTCARHYMKSQSISADWIFLGDYDLLPLRPRYLDAMFKVMAENGAGLAAKEFRDVSLSNCPYLLRHLQDGSIGPEFNGPNKAPVYHALGCAFAFHRECFDKLFLSPHGLSKSYFELGMATEASAQGFRLLSLDAHGDFMTQVRYRPVFSAEEAIAASGRMSLIHPVKEIDAFLDAWSAHGVPAVSRMPSATANSAAPAH